MTSFSVSKLENSDFQTDYENMIFWTESADREWRHSQVRAVF